MHMVWWYKARVSALLWSLLYELSRYGPHRSAGSSRLWQDWRPECHIHSAGTARSRIVQPTIALVCNKRFSGPVWAVLHPPGPPSGTVVHPVTMILSDEVDSFLLCLS